MFPHVTTSERQVVTGAGDRRAGQVGPVRCSLPAPIGGARALGMGRPGHSRVQGAGRRTGFVAAQGLEAAGKAGVGHAAASSRGCHPSGW